MRKLVIFCFACCSVPMAHGQSPDTLRRIDQLFSRWNNATPGGVVTVEREGKIIYNKAYGLADLEHNVPNTTRTIFEAGSVSKQFTAAAILLLEAEGKLSTRDDVRKYIPELPVYDGVITIQHCLNHTSGLKDWGVVGGLTGWPRTTRVYTQDLALQIICRQKSTNFYPGSEYSYSNSNYSVLVTIVERVTKLSLAELTQARLFGPAGMKNTQWRDNFREIVPNRSIAYRRESGAYVQEMPFENVHGHGGLLTTTEDLILWNHQLATHAIGGDAVYQQRIRQGQLNNGKSITYAGGVVVSTYNGFQEISHTGATAAYRAVLHYYPDKKLSIAILSNDGTFNPGRGATDIAEIFLGKPTPAKLRTDNVKASEEQLKRFNGIFRSVRGFDIQKLVYAAGEVTSNDRNLQVLHPDTLYLNGLYWIAKKPGQILLKSNSDTNTYIRVKSPMADVGYLKSLIGTYTSTEADVAYTIELRGTELWVNNPPHPAIKLTASFYDGFLSSDQDLYEFIRTKKGVIDRLEVNTSRAERVPFRKIR